MLCALAAMVLSQQTLKPPPFWKWAAKPPMGWNSWDCYGTTITEAQFKANVDVMAAKLKPFGWEYAVVDIQWYQPTAKGFDYDPNAVLTMDEFGRLTPALNRFPSAKDGTGFKALADYAHKKGLKFGIHLMRGVPRQAADKDLPIFGSKHKTSEIADRTNICPWNPDMYGVNMSKEGAQDYYDSVFKLIASWGVDFVKVDDLSRPYEQNQPEVEAIRRAIDKTKRPMVLSLSPGETSLAAADHVVWHANMWRISDDFWDSWPALKEQFRRLKNWNKYSGPGHFPDADMLPLGTLALGARKTNFTADEQITLMSLWSICKSPLMLGADMTKMDSFTESLLTNTELIEMNQTATNSELIYDDRGIIAWGAINPKTKDRYVAIFNTNDQYDVSHGELLSEGHIVNRGTEGQGRQILANLEGYSSIALVIGDAGDGLQWDHGLWVDPRLEMADGSSFSLVKDKWRLAQVGYGQPSTTVVPGGKPLMVGGKPVVGISAHAPSVVVYDLPPGAKSFSAFGALDDSSMDQTSGGTIQHFVYGFKTGGDQEKKSKKFLFDLGARVAKPGNTIKDLWTGQSWTADGPAVWVDIPWHGCKLFRISGK